MHTIVFFPPFATHRGHCRQPNFQPDAALPGKQCVYSAPRRGRVMPPGIARRRGRSESDSFSGPGPAASAAWQYGPVCPPPRLPGRPAPPCRPGPEQPLGPRRASLRLARHPWQPAGQSGPSRRLAPQWQVDSLAAWPRMTSNSSVLCGRGRLPSPVT